MSQEKSIKQKIFEANIETLESSSIHAIPNITRNRFYTVKMLWVICFLASSGICAWFIYNSITDYLNYDVVTNIEINYLNKIRFPIISICNINSNMLPANLNETIISCKFNFLDCDIYNDFEIYQDSYYSFCFRFNSGKNMNGTTIKAKYSYGKGDLNAFNLELYDRQHTDINNLFLTGFVVYLSDEAVDSVTDVGFYIYSGILTKVSINKNKLIRKSIPYSNCIDELTNVDSYSSECYKKTFSNEKMYKFSDCANMCLQKFIGDKCDFQLIQLGKSYYKEKRILSILKSMNQTDLQCGISCLTKFKNSDEFLKECDCPEECESSGYTHSLSYANYPTDSYAKYLIKNSLFFKRFSANYSLESFKKEILYLRIYFEDMKETVTKQEIKTQLADLISNLGGTLGLFLGK